MLKDILPLLSEKLSDKIIASKPITGGDISSAFQLKTANGRFFLKVNSEPSALNMFHAEQIGLSTIEATGTIAVPKVYMIDKINDKSLILMDFIESKRAEPSDYAQFGAKLAELHKATDSVFGFSSNNFIGSLTQSNNKHAGWAQFYWHERIYPQLLLALENGLLNESEVPTKEGSIGLFNKYFVDIKPSLLHGDLWGGNYLISSDGTPFLIDPAVYYGHSMVDISMSQLFGSFGSEFYNTYHEVLPKSDNYKVEIDLYQFYYLLVHLNLFGRGYYSSVSNILKKYF